MINFLTYISPFCNAILKKGQAAMPGSRKKLKRTLASYAGCCNAAVVGITVTAFLFLLPVGHAQDALRASSAVDFSAVSTPTIALTAYSADGTNSGIARLGRNVTILAASTGVSGATYTWTLTGPGTLSTSGVYTAPATMPSGTSVTVTAAITSNPAISASYQMSLEYAVPTIRWMLPATLLSGKTSAISLTGYDFTPATSILVNGTAVASSFQAPATIVAQVPVNSGVTQPLSVVAANPAPGGGASLAASEPVQTPALVLNAFAADGENTGVAYLAHTVTIQASVAGVSSPTINWTLRGAGTLTNAGVYTPPSVMTGTTATVTATLATNTSVSASYQMTLEYETPTIRWITPTKLLTGATNAVTVVGYDFTPATIIQVNGATVPTTWQAPNTIIAQIVVSDVSTKTRSVVAINPMPGGGPSTAVVATLQPLTVQLSSYNDTGLNPTSGALGQHIQFIAVVQGSGDANATWPIHWTVQGGGTISSAGLYKAPATMPSTGIATITATVTTVTSVHTSAQITLQNPNPVVNQSTPTEVVAGKTNAVTFSGAGFQQGTQIILGGTPLVTKYISSSAVSVSIPVSAGATAPLSVVAQNPAPGGGTSNAFTLEIAGTTTVSATIGSQPGLSIPGDFLGLSHDWNDAQSHMGSQAVGVNYIYRQLVTNLINPGSPFLIRIGGGSTDDSVAPTPTTVQPFVELAGALPVHFSLGVNLGSDNLQLAEQQASFFASQMPAGSLDAIEIGNEPDRYASNGHRSSSYTLTNYLSDFAQWQGGVQPLISSTTKLMGAAWASPYYLQQNFATMEKQQSASFSLVSQHFYVGHQSSTSSFPSDYLLQNSVVTSYVSTLTTAAATAHKNGQLFRVGEMNSIDNSGLVGVSNTFSAALWSVDAMFQYASIGVDGVNWHGMSGCAYCAFTFGIQNLDGKHVYTLQQVNPLYYGLLFFHLATGGSAQLLPVTLSSTPNVKVWATVDKSGTTRVAILNKDENFAGTVNITLPGYGQASVLRLVAPSYQSTAGVAIGDQTFDGSLDGNLVGNKANETLQPSGSVYEVSVQPTSAILLTLTAPN